jgi:hypothetical protein
MKAESDSPQRGQQEMRETFFWSDRGDQDGSGARGFGP